VPRPANKLKMPIRPLFRRVPHDTIGALYGTIVAQARRPPFYLNYGVPDTVNGRFDMIVLHVALLLRRLAAEPEPARKLGQEVFDRFCRDMDHNLREIGIGDLAVPKEMQRIAGAFYGRAKAYESALAEGDDRALAAALARNVHGAAEPQAAAVRLATYVREAVRHLAALDGAALAGGQLSFPDPEAV
jgi:cytochrome b pre-mRNA-processing protein 3